MSGKYRFGPKAATSGYTQLPNVVLYDEELSASARLLYAMLWDLATYAQDEPEQEEMAKKMGCAAKTLRGYLSELVKAGLVKTIRRGRGLTNAYEVNVPENGRNYRSRTGEITDPSMPLEDEEQDAGAKAPVAGAALERQDRARNLVFDALVEATNANPADGGMIGKAAKSIRTAMDDTLTDLRQGYLAQNPHEEEVPRDVIDELIAGQIRMRADLYRRLRPEWELTPTALAKHWNRIPTWQTRGGLSPTELGQITDEEILGG